MITNDVSTLETGLYKNRELTINCFYPFLLQFSLTEVALKNFSAFK